MRHALLLLSVPLLLGASAPKGWTALAEAEAKAGKAYAADLRKHGAWCRDMGLASEAREALQEARGWDARVPAGSDEAASPVPEKDGAREELQGRRKALGAVHAKAFLKLAQEARLAGSWGLVRRSLERVRALRPDAPGLEEAWKALDREGAEALAALDREMDSARTAHAQRSDGGGLPGHVLRLPEGRDAAGRCPLYVFIHGNSPDRGAGTLRFSEAFRKAGFAVLGPDCPSSLGQGSGEADCEQILRLVDRLVVEMGIDRDRVFLAAHSGGGNVAYAMIARHRGRLRGVAPIEANFHGIGIPASKTPDPFPVYVLKGGMDEHNAAVLDAEIAAALDALKKARLTNVRYEVVPGMTHLGFARCEPGILDWCQGILSGAST